MAPKAEELKAAIAKTNYVHVKNEFQNDNDEGEDDEKENMYGDSPQPDDEFNLDEVLRLGGTREHIDNSHPRSSVTMQSKGTNYSKSQNLDDDLAGDLDEDFGDELGEEPSWTALERMMRKFQNLMMITDSDEMEVPHTRPGSKKRNASEDLDFSDSLGSKPGKERRKQPCWHLLKSLCICWMKMLVLSLTTLA